MRLKTDTWIFLVIASVIAPYISWPVLILLWLLTE